MAKSRSIPDEGLTKVLLHSKRRCCICYREGSRNSVDGNVARLNVTPDHDKATGDNLVFLCLRHLARFDKGDLPADDVLAARRQLYEALDQEERNENALFPWQRYRWKVANILRKDMSERFGDAFGFELEPRLESRSGLQRQPDIAISLSALGLPLLILVEIKYSSRGLMMTDIEAIGAKFDDLGASKGIIVCNRGFTPDAIRRSKSMAIGLLQIVADEDSNATTSDKIVLVA